MYELLNALIEKQEHPGLPSKVKPKSSASLRRTVSELAARENARVPEQRRVTQRDVEVVASRSLNRTTGLDKTSRYFAAYRDVASFISLAIDGKSPVRGAQNRDLLPIGHPLSTRKHVMSELAIDEATARWIAADPRIHDEARPVVAAAYMYPLFSVEYTHAITRLAAMEPGLVPQDILIEAQTALLAVGIGGNSSAARSARARMQRRDDEGRFAFMGGLFSFLLRTAGDSKILSVIGKYVGNSPKGEGFVEIQVNGHSELPDGVYEMPVGKGKFLSDDKVKAVLPEDVAPDVTDTKGRDAVSIDDLVKLDAPTGWELSSEKADGESGPDKVFRSFDGYRVDVYEPGNEAAADAIKKAWAKNKGLSGSDGFLPKKANALGEGGIKPFDKDQPVYIISREKTDVTPERTVGAAQDWGFTQKFVQEDEEAFDKALAKGNEFKAKQAQASEQAKAKQEKDIAESNEVKKKNQQTREQIDANLAAGKDQFGNDLPEGWVAKKNEQALNPGWVAKYGDEEIIKDEIDLDAVATFEKDVDGVKMNVEFNDGKPVFEGGQLENWDDVEQDVPNFVAADKQRRREEAAEAVKKYDDGQIAKMILDGEADGEMVRQMLEDNPDYVSAKKDLDSSWAVDLPQKAQKDKWNALRDILKKVDALPDVDGDDDVKAELPEPDVTPEPEPEPTPEPEETPAAEAPEPEDIEWDLPEGAYNLFKAGDYEPEGRIDEESPDFTDDPKVLANKFGKEELVSALAEAIVGKKDFASEFIDELLEMDEDEGAKSKPGPKKKKKVIKDATGYGRLDFAYGEEMVPAEAIYSALREQGEDVDLIAAELYDLALGENKNVDKLNDARTGEDVTQDDGIAILESFDEEFDDVAEVVALNKWLAMPDAAQAAAVQLQEAMDSDEPNQEIVKMAELLDGFDESVDVPALLAVNIEMAFSDNEEERQAFKGLFALLLSTDGGYTTKGEPSMLSDAVRQGLLDYNGSEPSQQDIDDFFDEFGYYTDLLDSKEQIATGEKDIFNDDTLAGAMYRLIAQMSKPNDTDLFRGIQLDPDSDELKMYTENGGFISIDPRSFTNDKITAGNFAGVFSKNTDKVSVIFTVKAGDGNAVDLSKISLFELENESLGWGNYKIVEVKEGTTPEGKTRFNVQLQKLSAREAVLEGYNDNFEGLLLENENVDMPGEYYQLDTDAYEPKGIEGMSEEYDDSPLTIARLWETEDLINVFRGGVEDGSGTAILEYPVDDGFDAQIQIEAIRDALQIQGFDTNEILKDIANTSGTPEVSEGDKEPIESTAVNPKNEIIASSATSVDISDWEQKTDALGSNEGGFFEDPDGNRYYVKKAKSDMHARNEILASALYRALGIDSAEMIMGVKGDDVYTVSPDIENSKQDLKSRLNDPEYKKKIQEGFAIDAWLANWDVGGLVYDNIMTDGDGNPVRVDPGGALMYRAMGAPKGSAFSGTEVPELDTLRDPNMNSVSADIFGDMTEEEQIASARKLLDISLFEIDEFVEATVGASGEQGVAEELKNILKGRRQVILERYGLAGEDTGLIAETVEIEDADSPEPNVSPSLLEWEKQLLAEVEAEVGNQYRYSDGSPIEIGDEVVYQKTGETGKVIKYDKGNTNYVYVQIGDEKPKVKSTKKLEKAGAVPESDDTTDFTEQVKKASNLSYSRTAEEFLNLFFESSKYRTKSDITPQQAEELGIPDDAKIYTINPDLDSAIVQRSDDSWHIYKAFDEDFEYGDTTINDIVEQGGPLSIVGDSEYIVDRQLAEAWDKEYDPAFVPDTEEGEEEEVAEETTPTIEPTPDAGPEPEADKPEPGSSGNTVTIDMNQDVREQVEAAAAKGDIIRFFYNGKVREVAAQSVWDNPKNGNVNVYGEDLGDGQKKNFTVSKFEGIPDDAPEPEVTVDAVDDNADQPISDEQRQIILDLIEKKDLGGEPAQYVNDAASPFLTEGEGAELLKKLEALPDKTTPTVPEEVSKALADPELDSTDSESNTFIYTWDPNMPARLVYNEETGQWTATDISEDEPKRIGSSGNLEQMKNAVVSYFDVDEEDMDILQDDDDEVEEVEEVAPPEPSSPDEPTIENASGNEIYGGVEVVDKKGKQGTVKKVNKDDYAFVEFDDGTTGWRSVKTLTTTGQIKEGVAPAPKTAKPKAGKITPAGAEVVVVENPDSWDSSNFEEVPSLLDAMSLVQNTDDKAAAMRGASAAIDSDSIEDLDVRVMRVRDENGTDGMRLKFKLTGWAGNAKAKELLALDKDQANALGITRTPSMRIERIDIGEDGIGQVSSTENAYSANNGYSWKIRLDSGIVINFHRGNTTATKTVSKSAGTRAFHNSVEIQAPAGATPQQIQEALERAGVADARPATERDARVLIENRLMSVLGGKTDATSNPKGEEREKILQSISDKYGITPDDVVIETGVGGRIETKLSEEGARKIVEATGNPEAIQHNITIPWTANELPGGYSEWIARLLSTPQGGLLSTTTRWTEGIGGNGMSSHTDVSTGGADYVFTKPVANASSLKFGTSNYVMYFDPAKVYRRLDFYANYNDKYGARMTNQDVIAAAKTGAYEVMFKQRLGFEDMIAMVVPTIEIKNEIIAELKKMGITQIGGKPIESAITIGSEKEKGI